MAAGPTTATAPSAAADTKGERAAGAGLVRKRGRKRRAKAAGMADGDVRADDAAPPSMPPKPPPQRLPARPARRAAREKEAQSPPVHPGGFGDRFASYGL